MPDTNEIMTIRETAKYLKISVSQVRNLIRREDNPLPSVYLTPATPRIVKEQLDAWVLSNNQTKDE